MPTQRPLSHWYLLALLALYGASALACRMPTTLDEGISPDPKIVPEEGDDPEVIAKQAPELGPAPNSPDTTLEEAAKNSAQAPAPVPSDAGEQECEQASRPVACLRFAHEALRSQDPNMAPRAAMALSYACELQSGRGCYEYALLSWWGVGVAYQPSEIEYGFTRARELGEPMAQRGYASLLVAPASEAVGQDNDAAFHQSAACSLGVVAACGGPQVKPQPAPPVVTQPAPPVVAPPAQPAPPVVATPAPPAVQPAPAPKAALRGAQKIVGVAASGGLTSESARRTAEQSMASLTACYERELEAAPKLAGKIVAQIGVDEGGMVRGVRLEQSSLQSVAARDCMADAIRLWRFEPSQNKMTSLVVYTAEFTSAAAR